VNPDELYKIEVFQGRFLDAKSVVVVPKCVISSDIPDRSSVMFGVFLSFGVMIFAIVRAYSPSLILFSIFGTIAIDIFCVRVYISYSHPCTPNCPSQAIGPLYPFANYQILNSVLIAASCYCAMALVCCFVFFPETVNHAYLGLLSTILGKVKAMLMSQEGLLVPNTDLGSGSPRLKALVGDRTVLMTMYQNREYRLLFLHQCSRFRFQ
jgi:hypothetical protein